MLSERPARSSFRMRKVGVTLCQPKLVLCDALQSLRGCGKVLEMDHLKWFVVRFHIESGVVHIYVETSASISLSMFT